MILQLIEHRRANRQFQHYQWEAVIRQTVAEQSNCATLSIICDDANVCVKLQATPKRPLLEIL